MHEEYAASVSAVAAAFSSVVTAIAALGVFLQVKAAAKAHNGTLFLAFTERYNASEMAESLRALAIWGISHSNDSFAMEWVQNKARGDKPAMDLNGHRRFVSRYYFDVARLFQARLISREHARALLTNNGLNVFYLVCEPMNRAAHPSRVTTLSDTLRRLCRSYGDGTLHSVSAALDDPGEAQA